MTKKRRRTRQMVHWHWPIGQRFYYALAAEERQPILDEVMHKGLDATDEQLERARVRFQSWWERWLEITDVPFRSRYYLRPELLEVPLAHRFDERTRRVFGGLRDWGWLSLLVGEAIDQLYEGLIAFDRDGLVVGKGA